MTPRENKQPLKVGDREPPVPRRRREEVSRKPNNKRPQLWASLASVRRGIDAGERFRILYPDGSTEWAGILTINWGSVPCWQQDNDDTAIRMPSFKKRIALMQAYDKERGAEPAFFVENL